MNNCDIMELTDAELEVIRTCRVLKWGSCEVRVEDGKIVVIKKVETTKIA